MTMAIIPEPGQDRNPYEKDEVTHVKSWNIALSHMNRELQLTPMAYHHNIIIQLHQTICQRLLVFF